MYFFIERVCLPRLTRVLYMPSRLDGGRWKHLNNWNHTVPHYFLFAKKQKSQVPAHLALSQAK